MGGQSAISGQASMGGQAGKENGSGGEKVGNRLKVLDQIPDGLFTPILDMAAQLSGFAMPHQPTPRQLQDRDMNIHALDDDDSHIQMEREDSDRESIEIEHAKHENAVLEHLSGMAATSPKQRRRVKGDEAVSPPLPPQVKPSSSSQTKSFASHTSSQMTGPMDMLETGIPGQPTPMPMPTVSMQGGISGVHDSAESSSVRSGSYSEDTGGRTGFLAHTSERFIPGVKIPPLPHPPARLPMPPMPPRLPPADGGLMETGVETGDITIGEYMRELNACVVKQPVRYACSPGYVQETALPAQDAVSHIPSCVKRKTKLPVRLFPATLSCTVSGLRGSLDCM